MKRHRGLGLAFLLCFTLTLLPSCKRSTQAAARPPTVPPTADRTPGDPGAPRPTVEISASPGTVERGGQTTLQWSSANSSTLLIDSGVGNVPERGSVVVSPRESTTYTAIATGPGGEARGSTRVTVVARSDGVTSTDIENLQRVIDEGRVKPVFFLYDRAELSSDAKRILEQNARWFREFPAAPVVIEGHCDERGTEEYNLALGDRRALVVRSHLGRLGVDENRLRTLSYGEERPFDAGHDEAAWRVNRRAHFVVER